MGMPTPNMKWIGTGFLPPLPAMQEDDGPAAYGCSCGDGCVLPGCSQCLGLSLSPPFPLWGAEGTPW